VTEHVIRIRVQVRESGGKAFHEVEVSDENPRLSHLLQAVSQEAWGERFFEAGDEPARLKPGHLLVLENRMVQPWEIEDTTVSDGQTLSFVPVVAGG